MPTDDIFQAGAPDAPTFAHPMIVGPIQDRRPFAEDDLNHIVSEEPFSCDRLRYYPLPLSREHAERPGLYFVGDYDHETDEIDDTLTWTRHWSTIPAARVVPIGTYAYRFPGLPNGTTGSSKTITAMSPPLGNVQYVDTPVFTSAAHGFTVGQRLRVDLTYTGATTGGIVTVIAVTTNTFTTTGILLYVGTGTIGTFTSGSAVNFAVARDPESIPADAIEVYSYALPGVTSGIATAADFRADPLFRPVDNAGKIVDTLSATTTPSDTAYRASVTSGAYLAVESGIRRYLGQILERRTLLVRYS